MYLKGVYMYKKGVYIYYISIIIARKIKKVIISR